MAGDCEHRWELTALTWCTRDYECRACGTTGRREARWVREDGLKQLLWDDAPHPAARGRLGADVFEISADECLATAEELRSAVNRQGLALSEAARLANQGALHLVPEL